MIIKNPYNVIAKHYKLINALLLVPMVYLLLKYRDIARFFRDFVASNYKNVESNLGETYVTSLCLITTGFMIAYNAIMYMAYISKKKNGLMHMITAIAYTVIIILALLFHNTMESLSNIEPTFANFVRDMANLAVLPQYFFIAVTFINAIGFNVKTLRFDRRTGLEVDEDEEEIEIRLGSDDNAGKRNAVRLIRELKYYILENKFVFSIIGIGVVGIILITIYVNLRITNRVYSFNQELTAETFQIALKESYISNVDYQGRVIAPDTYFLVIKMGLRNTSYDTPIDKSVFRIVLGDKVFFPTYDRSDRFADIGKPYNGEVVHTNEENDYVFVYELKEKEVKGTYQLKILNKLKAEDDKILSSYKTINVKPKNLTKKVNLGEVNTGKAISLKETTLGNTTIKISNIKVLPYYEYTYEVCNANKTDCRLAKYNIVPSPGRVLMVMEDEINYDEKCSYYKNTYRKFYEDFVTLRYKPAPITGVDRAITTSAMLDVTPLDLKGERVYEVSNELLTALKIDMVVNIRNWRVIIKVKE